MQAVTESSATIVWFTKRNCVSKVGYGPVDGSQVATAVSARHGRVSFLVLDCGEDKADTNKDYSGLAAFDAYMAEQTQWLRQAVRSDAIRAARYRVVLAHIPPIASAQAYGVTRIRNLWSPHPGRGGHRPGVLRTHASVRADRGEWIDGQTVEALFVKSRSTE